MTVTHPKIGDIVEVEVVGMQDYGAFVKFFTDRNSVSADSASSISVSEKIEQKGLIHISEIQSGYVKTIHDIVKIGQKLKAQIIDIDEFNGKISLSIRSLEKSPQIHHFYRKKHFTDPRDKIGFKSLEKELPKWVEENEAYLKEHKN
ncbi:S1 RNA-binding domain-containing protein [Lactococcus protaetiae]|uniref:S1 RNA-binding domain-containing protein n=1 Tax=Lactococcus protaetiae TaxID=2592653 RepID=A0A514ZA96_9LACT|nr:S1 RNA-binding domain-containing protein [Lactococcus protaetiae]QDK71501.1 S1 RNA-binding domain-containing protein [Lactococcus protaetiae]